MFKKKHLSHQLRRLFPLEISGVSSDKPVVWVHAVSVGEVMAVAPVLQEFIRFRPEVQIILSTVTETGLSTAKKIVPWAICAQLSFDFVYAVRKMVGKIQPALLIFSEGDLWPVFINEMKERGARIAVVNGKISDKTYARFQRFSGWAEWLYGFIDLFCVQNEDMMARYIHLGATDEKVFVTGNTKTDNISPLLSESERADLRKKLYLFPSDRVVILGSTHPHEETMLISELFPLIKRCSETKVIVVPRHPERACDVLQEIKPICAPLKVSLYSSLDSDWRILIIDALGVLTELYQISSLAVVCGSFLEKIGGHNIFEPAAYGLPVIVGPYMHAQRTLFKSAQESEAVLQVFPKELSALVDTLLQQEEKYLKASQDAKLWANSLHGSAKKTAHILSQLLV